ncbi:hypothetical protein LWI28_000590 [Acer negundo]|uniref:Uncharacterized protein n=1 Tax=Acer negundo TaxID=4023 RepID=A0AAD5II19_ACENE|nr:hypothetical protein LWI28_000590 [Acer negundo]
MSIVLWIFTSLSSLEKTAVNYDVAFTASRDLVAVAVMMMILKLAVDGGGGDDDSGVDYGVYEMVTEVVMMVDGGGCGDSRVC